MLSVMRLLCRMSYRVFGVSRFHQFVHIARTETLISPS